MNSKIQTFVNRIDSAGKCLRICRIHTTCNKIFNLLINETEFRTNKNILSSTPYFLKIEPTPNCHLKCPQCAHGKGELKNKYNEKMNLTFDNFKKIIDPFKNNLFYMS